MDVTEQIPENVVDELFAEIRRVADGDKEVMDRMKQEFAENPELFMAKFCKGMSTMLRDESLDGTTGILKICMGEQVGGGRGGHLKVPKEDLPSLNAERVKEYHSFPQKQTDIKNAMAGKNGITKEVE